jgi:hypothetical protein
VARPDGQRERHGVEPDESGSQHRRRHDSGREGRLSRKITVDARGEILELKSTVNTMVDQLNAFADEVTRRERGGH